MGNIYYIMGKSSSGKDTIYKKLLIDRDLILKKVTGYTTRPMRAGEKNGNEYFFVNEDQLNNMIEKNIVIECRSYDTIYGIWKYFTADDGQIDLNKNDYLLIGTLDSYEKVRKYYGEEKVIPIYINVEDGLRLKRALNREMEQKNPGYEELCRRFLADQEDFKKENLERLGIKYKYENDNMSDCIEKIKDMIKKKR